MSKTDLEAMTVISREVLVERLKGRVERMKADIKLLDTILEIVNPDTLPADAAAPIAKAKEQRDNMVDVIGELLSVLHWLQREPA